jgi:hypothetical protein
MTKLSAYQRIFAKNVNKFGITSDYENLSYHMGFLFNLLCHCA